MFARVSLFGNFVLKFHPPHFAGSRISEFDRGLLVYIIPISPTNWKSVPFPTHSSHIFVIHQPAYFVVKQFLS